MKKKILIVDDDQYVRNSLSALLTSEDYVTYLAEDKISAFVQIKKNSPDLILLDVHISTEQEGYKIAQEFLNDQSSKNIPVIIFTNSEIISGNNKIIELARKFRNNPQFEFINAILNEKENGEKILEYKVKNTGEIISLPIKDVISKPIDTTLLLESIENVFN